MRLQCTHVVKRLNHSKTNMRRIDEGGSYAWAGKEIYQILGKK